MYRKHFTSSSHLTLDFKDLDSNKTVADIHKQYPINWLCREDSSMPEFGDSYCFDELQSWNELSVFTVVIWFKNGKLSAGKIDYPLWLHEKVVSELKNKYGEPNFFSKNKNNIKAIKNIALYILINRKSKGARYKTDEDIFNDKLGVWYLPKRTQITTSLDNESNVFGHNTILWQVY